MKADIAHAIYFDTAYTAIVKAVGLQHSRTASVIRHASKLKIEPVQNSVQNAWKTA
jgi:hypothetical protein